MSETFFQFNRTKLKQVDPKETKVTKKVEPEYVVSFKYYDWLKDAKIYNKRFEKISSAWIQNSADILVLYFSLNGVDKDGIIKKFYTYYEDVKHENFPIEVVNVPQDDDHEETIDSYERQANWFTFKYGDTLIPTLKYFYEITSAPHLLILGLDGTIISQHGIQDLEQYGKNALMCWLPHSGAHLKPRRLKLERNYYDYVWRYYSKDSYLKLYNRPKRKYKCRFMGL